MKSLILIFLILFITTISAQPKLSNSELTSIRWLIKQYQLDWSITATTCQGITTSNGLTCRTLSSQLQTISEINIKNIAPVDQGEPGPISLFDFAYLETLSISSVAVKNDTYNILSIINTFSSNSIFNIRFEGLSLFIPSNFPRSPKTSIQFVNTLHKNNITSNLWGNTVQFSLINPTFESGAYLLLSRPSTYVSVNNLEIVGVNPSNIFPSNPNLGGQFLFSLKDITLTPAPPVITLGLPLNSLKISHTNLTITQSYLQSLSLDYVNIVSLSSDLFLSNFDLFINNSILTNELPDYTFRIPNSISIYNSNVKMKLVDGYCSTWLDINTVTLTSTFVPNCMKCHWDYMKDFLPNSLAAPPANFNCDIMIYENYYLYADGTELLQIYGSNLGYGQNLQPGLSVQRPNQNLYLNLTTEIGRQTIVVPYYNNKNYTYEIIYGPDSFAQYGHATQAEDNVYIEILGVYYGVYDYFVSIKGQSTNCAITITTKIFLNCTLSKYTLTDHIPLLFSYSLYDNLIQNEPIAYMPFEVTSISNISINGGKVYIKGNYGPVNQFDRPGANIQIGGETVDCIYNTYNETTLTCTLPSELTPGTTVVNAWANGWLTTSSILIYNTTIPIPDQCGPNSKCNGNGNCINRVCQCFTGYSGYYCESKIDSGVVILPNSTSPSPTIVTQNGLGFSFNIIAVQELDSNGVVQSQIKTTQWRYEFTTNENLTTHTYKIEKSDTHTQLKAILEVSTIDRTVIFANQSTFYPAGSLKLSMEINNWNYSSVLNNLRVVMITQLEKNVTGSCDSDTISDIGVDEISDSMNYIKITYNDRSFYGRFLSIGLSDNRTVIVENHVINSTTKGDSFIGITLPYCKESCVIDPDFSVLINTDTTESICKDDGKMKAWLIATIASVGGVIALAAVITITILIKKKKNRNSENARMENKLRQFSDKD